jgi:tetratricopeptide (TPR) repeat protein
MPDEKMYIITEHSSQLTTKITAKDATYIIQTEEKGNGSTQVCSKVYLKGRVLFAKDTDFSHLLGSDGFEQKLNTFMTQLQKSCVKEFTDMVEKSQRKVSEYLNEARSLLRAGRGNESFQTLKEGLGYYPNDLLLLSYYGFLSAHVGKKPKESVRICRDAISKLDGRVLKGRNLLYPIFYLNLGRAYLSADKKKDAIRAFNIGLTSDPANANILAEIKKLGNRRPPLFSFLERSSPLNRYFGLLLFKAGMSR